MSHYSLRLITLFIALASFFYTSASYAQSSVWQATKGSQTIYLAGSVHLLRATDYPLPREFTTTLENAKNIYLEADTKSLEHPEMLKKILPYMLSQDGTLSSKLDAKTRQKLLHFCTAKRLNCAAIEPFNPGWASLMLSLLTLESHGYTDAFGVETYVIDHAQKTGKKLAFLETIEDQIQFIQAFNQFDQNMLITQAIDDLQDAQSTTQQLVAAWKSGNNKALENLGLKDLRKQYPEIYKILISKRNHNWLQQIPKISAQPGATIIIVGALHLVGPDGLIKGLEKRGFKVAPVTATAHKRIKLAPSY